MTPPNHSAPLSSYATAIDEIPGSKWNPIVVEDEDELGTFHNPIEIKEEVGREEETKRCERCGQTGHIREDCDTPIRSFTICEICKWKKQKECNHYDISPAWTKRMNAGLEEKGRQYLLRKEVMKEHPDGRDAQ
jgi:hypothetical protein